MFGKPRQKGDREKGDEGWIGRGGRDVCEMQIGRLGFQSDVAIVSAHWRPVAIKMEKSELRQRPDFMPLCQSSTGFSPAGELTDQPNNNHRDMLHLSLADIVVDDLE